MQHLVDTLTTLATETFKSQSCVQDEPIARNRELAEITSTYFVAHNMKFLRLQKS